LKNRQTKGNQMSKTPSLTTLAIESKREEIAAAKAELAKLIRMRKDARIQVAAERAAAKELKAIDRAEKKAARIAKLEAKLLALKTKPVGTKAIKANKKPSKVTVLKMAA
jgi:capsule polysaccharide export protein KpsE/RkpR